VLSACSALPRLDLPVLSRQFETIGEGGGAVVLPPVRDRLVLIATQEWNMWSQQTVFAENLDVELLTSSGHKEHEPEFATRVLHYWYAFNQPSSFHAADAQYPDGSLRPWSAAFISYVMRTAGVDREDFPYSGAHWDYMYAIAQGDTAGGVVAFDSLKSAPTVGDLICAPRDATANEIRSFDDFVERSRELSTRAYHCDVVVSIAGRELKAIGGNVLDSVSQTIVALTADGLLVQSESRHWIMILRVID
jgi:hypothetical protein